jgi:hypothetical protein
MLVSEPTTTPLVATAAFGTRRAWRHAGRFVDTLLRALAAHGNPSFFEFERRGAIHHRLGPGVQRVSDSFWPMGLTEVCRKSSDAVQGSPAEEVAAEVQNGAGAEL